MFSLEYDDKGKIRNGLSAYQPSGEVKDLTTYCLSDYRNGDEIMHRPFTEFNDLSVIGRMNEDQKAWLSWTPPPSPDPEEAWRWNGIRPMTRNKIISVAAHLTSQLIYPNAFAQNDDDEEDRDASYVAEELIHYNVEHSNYETCFLYGTISALVNPVTYWEVEYTQSYQDIFEGTNSDYTKKEVIDDVLSGFQNHLIPADGILISNPYQFELQKQKCLIKRRRISYDEAEGLYGDHENWQHVKPGVVVIMGEDGLFYDVEDVNGDLVEECTYYYRRLDRQVTYINNIYLGNPNVEYNPFTHRTNKNKPKYPFSKFGAEPIDPMRFFYYKSIVAKLSNDQEAIDREWQMYFDASFLATMPPVLTSGAGKFDKSVVVPATVTEIGKGATVTPMQIANPMAAAGALREAERSLSESSQDTQSQGIAENPQKTARESILLQQNADTNRSILIKMIGTAVKEVGELMLDDILRYQTVGEMTEILGGLPKMKFRTFILPNRVKEGRNVTNYIRFTDSFAGTPMTKGEKDNRELEMYQEAGDDKHVYDVNPELFSRWNYLVVVDYEQLMQRNTAFERAYKLEVYDKAIQNPLVDGNAITRDFLLEPLVKGQASKYMKDVSSVIPGLTPPEAGNGQDLSQRMGRGAAMQSVIPGV